MIRATRDSWRTVPMPELRAALDYRASFGPADGQRLRRGLVPDDMDDKWFVFFEDGWLYAHRSWTGFCIYALKLEDAEGGVRVGEAWVNRDPAQHASTVAAADAQVPDALLRRLRQNPLPSGEGPRSEP